MGYNYQCFIMNDDAQSILYKTGTLDQLRAEENQALRAGVIAGGGLVGLLFGMMRGRFIKRLFYTGLGAGGAAAVCYPNEATDLSKEAYTEAQRLGYIAYNFVTGGNLLTSYSLYVIQSVFKIH